MTATQPMSMVKTSEKNDNDLDNENEQCSLLEKDKDRHSISTGGSSKMAGGRARMLNETFGSKINAMFWPLVSLFFNCGMFVLLVAMQKQLVVVSLDAESVRRYFPVSLEIILEGSNVLTFFAADNACCVLFGYLLSRDQGFSLAACGFSKK